MERGTGDIVLLCVGMLVSTFFLVRLMLIRVGLLKEPVLRHLQSYADTSVHYYPLPAVLGWAGLWVMCVGLAVMRLARSSYPAFLPGIVIWFAAALSIQLSGWFMSRMAWVRPQWLRDLEGRADRDEQRKIAYAWLRLPTGMRRRLNAHDHEFAAWADLVILSTSSTIEDTFVYASHYRLLKTRIAET